MKKLIVSIIICVYLIGTMVCFSNAEDISFVKYDAIPKELNYNSNIMWDGKEWISMQYPPEISIDGINFERLNENEELKEIFKDNCLKYLWTGRDYLVYHSEKSHTYMAHNLSKYLYRVSEDMNAIIDKYEIPDNRWINNIIAYENRYYISTEKVIPKYVNDEKAKVYGEVICEFEIFICSDFNNWQVLELPFELQTRDIRPSIFTSDGNNMLIANYQAGEGGLSTSGEYYPGIDIKNIGVVLNDIVYNVNYESFWGKKVNVCDNYYYTELNSNNTDELIAFSLDGIYWYEIDLNKQSRLLNIYEKNGKIIIKCLNDGNIIYNICDQNELHSFLEESTYNNIYVQLNDKILGFSQPPVMEDARTLVPMRFLFEQMGASVDWNDETQTATASVPMSTEQQMMTFSGARDELQNTVTFSIDNTTATVNGETETMDVPARLINDQTFVPLRFLSENLGCDVQWDETTNTAIVTTE